jgi:hypothetical protein
MLLASVAIAGAATRSAPAVDSSRVSLSQASDTTPADAAAMAAAGRYKKQGANCEWDANDNGPNQCTPLTEGRFKKSGDACVWDANDKGADQCKPATGRFKKEGDRCVWNGTDSGPNQCNPRQSR